MRALYPANLGAGLNLLVVPLIFVMAGGMFWKDDQKTLWMFGIFGGAGTLLGTYPFSRSVVPDLSLAKWLRGLMVWCFLCFGGLIIIVLGAWMMPNELGWRAWIVAIATLVLKLGMSWGLLSLILRVFHVLKPPPQRLQRIATAMSDRMNVKFRHVWLMERVASYAAALPVTRELIFSRPLLEKHPDEEIAAICAHELAHLTEPRRVRIGRLIGSLTLFPIVFIKLVHGPESLGEGLIPLSMLGLLLLARVMRGHPQRMEIRADEIAVGKQIEAGIYARALERMHEANQIPAVMPGRRRTHPDLYDRMLAAGVTPGFPRPLRPSAFAWNLAISFALLIILLTLGMVAF